MEGGECVCKYILKGVGFLGRGRADEEGCLGEGAGGLRC